MIIKLIESYFEGVFDLLQSMENAVFNRNSEELFQAAHTMKTNNSMVGAIRMTKFCIELEKDSRSGILDNSEELFAELKKEFSYVKNKLQLIVEDKIENNQISG